MIHMCTAEDARPPHLSLDRTHSWRPHLNAPSSTFMEPISSSYEYCRVSFLVVIIGAGSEAGRLYFCVGTTVVVLQTRSGPVACSATRNQLLSSAIGARWRGAKNIKIWSLLCFVSYWVFSCRTKGPLLIVQKIENRILMRTIKSGTAVLHTMLNIQQYGSFNK